MDLSGLTDHNLLLETERLVKQERGILSLLLRHLGEIDSRRLYSSLGYPSLYQYTVKELGYAEDQAYRRIAALRTIRELPEIESKVASGALTLTNLSLARALFKKENYTREQKLEVLAKLEGKTTREAERVVKTLSPDLPRPDSIRAIGFGRVEVRFEAPESIVEKLEALKGLLAHKYPGIGLGELVEVLCELGLESWGKTAAPRDSAQQKDSQAALRRKIWQKAGGQCENCGSRYALEIDHKQPKALGGEDTEENLRLLCRSCNQRAAIEALGFTKMQPFLQPP